MAYFSFTKNIMEGKEIKIFNHGDMKRNFTYIDDIVEAIVRSLDTVPTPSPRVETGTNPELGTSHAPYLEELIGKKAKMTFLPMQLGDVQETYADIRALQRAIGFPQLLVSKLA